MTTKATVNGIDCYYDEIAKVWRDERDDSVICTKDEMPDGAEKEQTPQQKAEELQQEAFKEKVELFTKTMEGVCLEFGVQMVAGMYFTQERTLGSHAYGETTTIEELGLATLIKQKFNL